MRCDMR